MILLFLHLMFILKAVFFLLGFTIKSPSERIEYLYISLTICTQAFRFVHLVKCSEENVLKAFSSYHWETEINSLTLSKSFTHLFCLGIKQLCLARLLLLFMCFGHWYLGNAFYPQSYVAAAFGEILCF